jgi:ABC-2 type transport system permease protein
MQSIRLLVIDNDLSSYSRGLTTSFSGSPFFRVHQERMSPENAFEVLMKGEADAILSIPENLEYDCIRNEKPEVLLQVNAINGTAAGLISGYSSRILQSYNQGIALKALTMTGLIPQQVEVVQSFWYNPEMNYKIYMLPGILVILVTVVGMFLTAINIVREKEMGTIEQINVTPVKKYQFITGKLIPFWIIAMFELFFGLGLGVLFFQLPIEGSLGLIALVVGIYLMVVLALGLLLSVVSQTQQQVMFVSFFFLLVFILMSGLFTPVETMPDWAQQINIINPFAYLMKVLRMVLLKGSDAYDILGELIALSIYALLAITLAVRAYRKTN